MTGRSPLWILAATLVVAASMSAIAARAPQDQPPAFKSSVELVAVDVQVVDRDGHPIVPLDAAQFEVALDGHRRQVVSADLIRYSQSATGGSQRTFAPPASLRYDGTFGPSERIFVLAVDQLSFAAGRARAAALAARHFIDRLQPDDVVGLYLYPGSQKLDLRHDRLPVRGALNRIVGLLEQPLTEFHLAISEVIDITAGDDDAICAKQVQGEAFSIGAMAEMQISQSFMGLRALLSGLAHLPGRKTVVLLSGGLLASDRGGGRPDMKTETEELGRDAAAANTNLYVLHLDTSFLDAFSAEVTNINTNSLFRDSSVLGQGLELLAGAAGGALFQVQAGTPEHAFDRVMREASAYYLLGLEVADADRDGKPHFISVKVKQRGATVRNRPMVTIPKSGQ